MNEESVSSLKQSLSSFDTYILLCENHEFPKKATVEEIKSAFKLGHLVEKTVQTFKQKNYLPQFMSILNNWRKSKNRNILCSNINVEYACDNLLCKFFEYPDLPEKVLDICIRIYTSLFTEERLHSVISNLILHHSSIEAILDSSRDIDLNNEEYHIMLNYFLICYEKSKPSNLKNEIYKLLSISKVEESLYLLIGILSLNSLCGRKSEVQNQILDCILHKMLDRSALSKSFWITLFKNVDKNLISKSCIIFNNFFNSLVNFIIYLGCAMEKIENVWIVNENISFCPEITFQDILTIFNSICKIHFKLKMSLILRLKEAKENTENQLWDEIRLLILD